MPRRWRTPPPPVEPRDGQQLAIAFAAALVAIVLWSPIFDGLSASTQVALAGLLSLATVGVVVRFRTLIARPGLRLDGQQLAVGCLAAMVALKSVPSSTTSRPITRR